MAATYRSVSSRTDFTTNGAKTCPTPTGITSGDFLIGQVLSFGTTTHSAYDVDYPLLGSFREDSTTNVAVFGGLWTGAAPAVTIATIQGGTGGNLAAIAIQPTGGGTLSIDTGSGALAQNNVNASPNVSSTITPTQNGCCVVVLQGGIAQVYTANTIAASFVERLDTENYGLNYIATLDQGTAAAVAGSITNNPTTSCWMTILAIKETVSTAQKNFNGLARASVKTRNGLAIASVKKINGLA